MSTNSDAYRRRRAEEARMIREATNERMKKMRENAKRRERAMNCADLVKILDNATCDKKGLIY